MGLAMSACNPNQCSHAGKSVLGMSMCIALAERYSNRFLEYKALEAAELAGGRASLAALVRMHLKDDASVATHRDSLGAGIVPVWA